ncbi:LysR family transcriptional regulator [Pseudomonas alcaligenes]|uniref:LysR family transcriptional regulator n=1 Tax=Aquipseudomonas alcaligenes TaxID=43263 RepID=A0ABR7S2M8_AQUAC|nr:LysR family transcriptional regulator [Pseudomonas alcaligenes]MBC9251826.1 LysR family transcriptional regulator [Pseudomonas alcaligenes]
MTRLDLRRVDLNLLVVFEMMMLERNVSRAAERLFLGQPAVSAALNRLRSLYNDPLFVRNGRSMEPTPRALELEGVLRPALDTISAAIGQSNAFDPATSREVFRIGLSDDVELGLLPTLLRHLETVAPNVVLVVRRTHYLSISSQLASGEISLGICYTGELPANAKCKTLRRSRSVLLRGDQDEAPLSLEQYCARPHALVSFAGDLTGFIDDELAKLGRSRRVKLAVPQFHGLSALLPGSELVASVPDYAAPALTAGGALRSEPLPFEAPLYNLSLAWSAAQDNDPAQRWLRAQIEQCLGQQG